MVTIVLMCTLTLWALRVHQLPTGFLVVMEMLVLPVPRNVETRLHPIVTVGFQAQRLPRGLLVLWFPRALSAFLPAIPLFLVRWWQHSVMLHTMLFGGLKLILHLRVLLHVVMHILPMELVKLLHPMVRIVLVLLLVVIVMQSVCPFPMDVAERVLPLVLLCFIVLLLITGLALVLHLRGMKLFLHSRVLVHAMMRFLPMESERLLQPMERTTLVFVLRILELRTVLMHPVVMSP